MKNFSLLIALVVLLVFGCEKPYDINNLPSGGNGTSGDTTYNQKAQWDVGFNHPVAIMYGRDQLFYVLDRDNNRVVMLNQAGQVLSILNGILRPQSIAQDPRLDLLIGASTINRTTHDTIGMLVRVKVEPASGHLDQAEIDTIWTEPARPRRRFVGVAVIPNDEYLVARDGPDNSSAVDPDARVLRFRYVHVNATVRKDSFITPLGDLQSGVGSSVTSINHPTGIATFPGKSDFIITQTLDGVPYGALWMVYSKTFDFDGWLPKFDPSQPGQSSVDFVRPNRFVNPTAATIASSEIYIVDSALDSVVKFTSRGFVKSESFGRTSSSIPLQNPQGIAVAEGTVYVCDTGNNRIVLYVLSTQL